MTDCWRAITVKTSASVECEIVKTGLGYSEPSQPYLPGFQRDVLRLNNSIWDMKEVMYFMMVGEDNCSLPQNEVAHENNEDSNEERGCRGHGYLEACML